MGIETTDFDLAKVTKPVLVTALNTLLGKGMLEAEDLHEAIAGAEPRDKREEYIRRWHANELGCALWEVRAGWRKWSDGGQPTLTGDIGSSDKQTHTVQPPTVRWLDVEIEAIEFLGQPKVTVQMLESDVRTAFEYFNEAEEKAFSRHLSKPRWSDVFRKRAQQKDVYPDARVMVGVKTALLILEKVVKRRLLE